MKKTYEAPSIEKIAFQYRNQVVAASVCAPIYAQTDNSGDKICDTTPDYQEHNN